MNKKAIAILGAILILILGTLGFLVYSRYSGQNSETPEVTDNTTTDPNTNPETVEVQPTTTPPVLEKFVQLTSEQVVSPILFYNGNGVTYLNQNGELMKADFQADANGSLTLTRLRDLGIQPRSGIKRILWPKNGDDFIAESGIGQNKLYSYFSFATGAYTDLPEQVKAVEWLPSGDKILFVWVDKDAQGNEKATLNLADPDTKNYQEIAELYESDDAFYLSPDGLSLAFHRTQNTGSTNKIIQTTPDGKIWKDLVKEGYNMGVLWSPDSQKFIFSKKDRASGAYQLWYYDLYAGEVKNLSLPGLPVKAVWGSDSRTVYVATPKGGAGISDYNDLNTELTDDTFFKIDTQSEDKQEYMPESMSIDGRDLFLNASEDKLFFKNAQDGGLYYLDLTQ